LVGPKPRWLALDASTGTLFGTTKLKPTKPLVVLTRTNHGARRILRKRPPHALSYNLYVTATDALGERSTQKLKLTVQPGHPRGGSAGLWLKPEP
jgi:Putative Ig domain